MTGILSTFAGPMYAGKTSAILQQILWLKHQQHNVLVIKPILDNRYSEDHIETHNQLSFPCFSARNWDHIMASYNFMPYNFHTIFLDEVQFMDTKLTISNVNKILSNGVNIVAAGLDQDSRGIPFETTALLLALSDKVEKIKAICTTCGMPATKTQRLDGASDDRIVVGSAGIYEPRCMNHWKAK